MMDIGCGNGGLLLLAQNDGWKVSGLELSAFLAGQVERRLGIKVVVSDFLTYQGCSGEFDLIVLRHVLEHLPDPILALERIRQFLRPGGVALM